MADNSYEERPLSMNIGEGDNYVDVVFRSTALAVDNFMKSTMWHDLQAVIKGQIKLSEKNLAYINNIDDIRLEQGKIQYAHQILELPKTILQNLEVYEAKLKAQEEGEQDAED